MRLSCYVIGHILQIVDFCSIIPVLFHGAVVQLGERLHGMQEVDGSSPFSSTYFWADNYLT